MLTEEKICEALDTYTQARCFYCCFVFWVFFTHGICLKNENLFSTDLSFNLRIITNPFFLASEQIFVVFNFKTGRQLGIEGVQWWEHGETGGREAEKGIFPSS